MFGAVAVALLPTPVRHEAIAGAEAADIIRPVPEAPSVPEFVPVTNFSEFILAIEQNRPTAREAAEALSARFMEPAAETPDTPDTRFLHSVVQNETPANVLDDAVGPERDPDPVKAADTFSGPEADPAHKVVHPAMQVAMASPSDGADNAQVKSDAGATAEAAAPARSVLRLSSRRYHQKAWTKRDSKRYVSRRMAVADNVVVSKSGSGSGSVVAVFKSAPPIASASW